MKRILYAILSLLMAANAWGQGCDALEQLRMDPKKAYGGDYPYLFTPSKLTKSPKGYRPFYISHYARHGSRYYWNSRLYNELDTMLTEAHGRHILTEEGEKFYQNFLSAKQELITGVSELTQAGWEQHQRIARNMYNNFPTVFKDGGNVLAISSIVRRCIISMSAFCQELVQCNPEIEIREEASRFTLNAVAPTNGENPVSHTFKKLVPKYEKNRADFKHGESIRAKIIPRLFTTTENYPFNPERVAGNLIKLYTSLPNIGHEGMTGELVTDNDIVENWENDNLESYSWVFEEQNGMIPILLDILQKADKAISGENCNAADLRFGHDSCIGPLTVLMGINGADLDPEDPYEVKKCYQNWETCKACNIQLIFYRGRKASDDILVKCLLNETEATLPVKTDSFPYYRWTDVRNFYFARCESRQL